MLKRPLPIALLLTAIVSCAICLASPAQAQTEIPPQTAPIIGGTNGPSTLFPAVAEIYIDSGICTGTLIDPEFVLTAGHCAFDDRGRVIKDMGLITIILGNEVRGAKALHVHPLYNNQAEACSEGIPDASLIQLDSPVYSIAPIEVSDTPPAIGTKLLLVGYGLTGPGVTGQAGGQFPSDGSLAYGYTTVDQVTPTFVFWKYRASRGGANTAGGDSGGPAFQTISDRLVLKAITCGGTGNAEYGTESLDTRADILIGWLSQFVASVTSTAPPSLTVPNIITVRAQRSIKIPIESFGAKPISVSVSGLPQGLSLKDGAIQGIATTPGSWPITFVAENDFGVRFFSSTLAVRPPDTIFKITRATLQYNQALFQQDLLLLKGQLIARQSRLLKRRSFSVRIGDYQRTFMLGINRRSYQKAGDKLTVNSVRSLKESNRSVVDFKISLHNSAAFNNLSLLGFSSASPKALGQRITLPITFEFDENHATIPYTLGLNAADLRWHLVP